MLTRRAARLRSSHVAVLASAILLDAVLAGAQPSGTPTEPAPPTPHAPEPAPVPEGSGESPGLEEEVVPGLEEEVVPGLEEEVVPGLEEEVVPGLEEEVVPGLEEEVVPGLEEELVPVPEEEVVPPAPGDAAPAPAAPSDEDRYYDQFWEQLDRQDAPPAPPQGGDAALVSNVLGKVIDAEFDSGLPDVVVSVDGSDVTARSDASGAFALRLAPGTWVVRLTLLTYAPAAFEVVVEGDEVVDLGALELAVDARNAETVVVEGRAIRENTETQLLARRESAAASDAVSAEEMSKAPDSAASDAVKRVVGATIVNDQFLYIRGLGGRYTCVTMNGTLLRGTDPDFPGVQLDVLPSDLLSNLTVYKSFSPDLSGGCAAGQLDAGTRDYPEDRRLTLSASVSGSTGTTFGSRRAASGGAWDWTGFDDGARDLRASLPDQRVELGAGLTREQVDAAGRAVRDEWTPSDTTAPPGFGLKATAGDSGEWGERRWGYLATASYGQGYDRDETTLRSVTVDGEGTLLVDESLNQVSDKRTMRWGALGTGTLEWGPRHQVTIAELWSHSASDRVSWVTTDASADRRRPFESRRLEWIQRDFSFTQLLGRHRGLWLESELSWNTTLLRASRVEPETHFLKRDELGGVWRWRPDPGSGEVFTSRLDQQDVSGGLDWKVPTGLTSFVKAGADAQASERTFDARRLRFNCTGCEQGDPRALEPDELFSDERVGRELLFTEETGFHDRYRIGQSLLSGFGLVDVSVADSLRLTGGVRFEQFAQTVTSGSRFAGQDRDDELTERSEGDWLPSVGAVLSLSETMFVRASYGGSVARPQGREIAPFTYQDYVRRRTITGNPDLIRTYVHSADVRWEWFPGSSEVVAASVFYKLPLHPIEQSYTLAGEIAFANVDAASNLGAEAEARFSLARFKNALSGWSLGANATVVASSVELSDEQRRAATNDERPMQGQAEFVVNGTLSWEPESRPWSANLLYNVVGRELDTVGLVGLPDTYNLPFHRLDLTASWRFTPELALRCGFRNVLLQPRRAQQGSVIVERQAGDLEGTLSVNWEPGR